MQEVRAEGRDPNLEDLKKMIRSTAKEKNDPVFGSILDPAKDVQNKEKFRSKPPVPKKTDSFAGLATFPDSSVVLISALFLENIWALFMTTYWLASAKDKKKMANKDLVLGQAHISRSPKVITWL